MRLAPSAFAAALLLATVATPLSAHASGPSWRGSCGFSSLNDTTPDGQLGGSDQWHGVVYLAIAPHDDAGRPTSATAWCELLVNGVSQGTVLGPTSGTALILDAAPLSFTASVNDVVSMCDHVTVGATTTVDCGEYFEPLVPQPVIDTIDQILDVLDDAVFPVVDGTICSVLATLAPGVPPLVSIDPTGDTYVGGTTQDDLVWDCPPYVRPYGAGA